MKISLKNLNNFIKFGFSNFQKDSQRFINFYSSFLYKLFFTETIKYLATVSIKSSSKFFNKYNYFFGWKNFEQYNALIKLVNSTSLWTDNVVLFLYALVYKTTQTTIQPRIFFRLNHNSVSITSKHQLSSRISNHLLLGLTHLWEKLNIWILPILLGVTVVYWSMILRVLTFNKVIIGWVILFMMFYWLMSGFVFFFKKYQYGKYTSAIQRFWKRSYILFWLLETCLLSVFIYLTFVASQESFYMFDQIQIYKTHLFSWRLFFLKIIPVVILLVMCYFLILTLKWNVFSKYSVWLLSVTLVLTYVVWIEFYQFYHIINFYGNLNWLFDVDERVWNLELESRRTRIVNNYVMWLLILKFWHLLFVYIFWLFFVLRSWEIKRARYPLLAANFQNILILYLMSWLTMYAWVKVFFRKFMDIPYNWFYVNNRVFFWRMFFNDLKIQWYGLLNLAHVENSCQYSKQPFFYLIETVKKLPYFNTQRHFIKTSVMATLNTYLI